MSDKYIIKNCPAYIHRPLSTHDRVCLLGDKVKPNHKELYVYCKDVTDCLLKQIVEKCKKTLGYVNYKCYFKRDTVSLKYEAFKTLNDILQLLDIQEVE